MADKNLKGSKSALENAFLDKGLSVEINHDIRASNVQNNITQEKTA